MAASSSAAAAAPLLTVTPPPCASLYVGDLDPDVVERDLIPLFSRFGTLASIRVCHDANTGRSLCYAYVNYYSRAHAFEAMKALNHTLVLGKPLRIMWSQRDPMGRKNGAGNVFVKNLDESVNGWDLDRLFSQHGRVLSVKVVMDGVKCKGFGFVQFSSEEEAQAAIRALHGTPCPVGGVCSGKPMYVAKFVRKNDRQCKSLGSGGCNLYVKNLDYDISDEALREKFSSCGQIQSAVVMKDNFGMSKGFGFVSFRTPDEAMNAINAMNGSKLGSKVVYVCKAQKKEERQQLLRRKFEAKHKTSSMIHQRSNLYVKNLDESIDDTKLRELFSLSGVIKSAKVICDDFGRSRGFGFVCFSSPAEAQKAIGTFHGYILHRKPLYVAIAQRKEERAHYLQLQFARRNYAASLQYQYGFYPTYPAFYQQSPNAYLSSQLAFTHFQYPQMLKLRQDMSANVNDPTGNNASGWLSVPQYQVDSTNQQLWLQAFYYHRSGGYDNGFSGNPSPRNNMRASGFAATDRITSTGDQKQLQDERHAHRK